MGNSAFNRLCTEFNANVEHNDTFRKFVYENYSHHKSMYGGDEFSTADMKSARDIWKKAKHLWYPSAYEWGLSVDVMPFGGWASEKDEIAFIKAYGKAMKEADKMGIGVNTATRKFMRQYDANWDF